MNGSWDAYLALPADFAGADDIITNLANEKRLGSNQRTFIITSSKNLRAISNYSTFAWVLLFYNL